MKQQRPIFCVCFFGLFCWIKGESLSDQNFQTPLLFFSYSVLSELWLCLVY